MSRHIVWPLIGVPVKRLVFFYQVVEAAFKVYPHGRVCIFIDGQTRRSMLNEDMQNSVWGQAGNRLQYFSGNEMKTPWIGGERDMKVPDQFCGGTKV